MSNSGTRAQARTSGFRRQKSDVGEGCTGVAGSKSETGSVMPWGEVVMRSFGLRETRHGLSAVGNGLI